MKTIVKEDISSEDKTAVLEIELDALKKIYEIGFLEGILSPYEYEQYSMFFESYKTIERPQPMKPSKKMKQKTERRQQDIEFLFHEEIISYLSQWYLMPPEISNTRKIQMMRLAYEQNLLPEQEYKKISDFEITLSCMNCGHDVKESKRYCPYCGTMI